MKIPFLSNFYKGKKKEELILPNKKNADFFKKIITTRSAEGFYSLLNKLPNPDPVLRKTGKGIEALRLLENEGQIATCIDSRKDGVTSLNWQLKHKNEKYKKFYDNLLEKIDIYSFIQNILNAPLYGFQPLEIIWKKDGEYIIPAEIIAPPQEWFFYNDDNQLCFKHKDYSCGLIIKPEDRKFLCPRHKSSFKNPYGQSLLSRCFWDTAFKKGGYEFWVKFMEKYSMPYFIGKYEEGANEATKEELLDNLVNMVQDAVVVIPNNTSVEIKEATGKGSSFAIYKEFIKLCDDNIAKNILGQTLTTDSGDKGSYSLGKIHAQVRGDIIKSDKRMVEKEGNILFSWIHQINFSADDAPKFELIEEQDLQAILNKDKTLYSIGVRHTPSYFQKTYDLEESDFTIVNERLEPTDFAETLENNPQETLERLFEDLNKHNMNKLLDRDIKPVVSQFMDNKDPNSALEKLAEIYPKMEFKELEETLSRIIFLSNIWGRANVKK